MKKIVIIGLGYVGLPLAVEFGKKATVIGYDINAARVEELRQGVDTTQECTAEDLRATSIKFTSNFEDMRGCQIYIVTVPTPVDHAKKPDFRPLIHASETIAKVIKSGDIVIYESTVYPGATEEICVKAIEEKSGLKYNVDFFCGYSPERINPGDKSHSIRDIKKITSGSTQEIAREVNDLYKSIIVAGTHLVSSMEVAEAAKVIENTQRDLNIAFVNELSLIFNRIGIDTNEVIKAASTKWNFMPFMPGLVGGHCIGVDPYYLTYKAQQVGYYPEVILAGRRVNDFIPIHVAQNIIKLLINKTNRVNELKVLVRGVTFKENCPDIRNSKVFEMVGELKEWGVTVELEDPYADSDEVEKFYGYKVKSELNENNKYDAIIISVAHKEYKDSPIQNLIKYYNIPEKMILGDIKNIYDKNLANKLGFITFCL